ncbi:MAG: hypothetical protein ACRENP_05220 [Longimicrobiales bacterium]
MTITTTMKTCFRASLVLALVVGVAGCQDTSGPGSLNRLNAAAALADYNAMDGVLQSSGWKRFQMTASGMDVTKFGFAPAAAARATEALRELAPGGDPRAFAAAMASVANAAADGAASVPLISDENRGKTFVFDAQRHDWVVDPTRTGAPANGVRFITYEPKGAEPDPTKPIGHADLIDLGNASPNNIALRLVVAEGNLTVLDYKTTLEGSEGSGHVTVEGFIQNQRDKLDFDIDVRGQNTGGVERGAISFGLTMASRDFQVNGEVQSEKQNGSERSAVDLSVRHGSASFRVDVANDRGTLSGDIHLNNTPFAELSGVNGQPVFKTPTGDDIGGSEALVLWRIFDITEDVFDLFEDLVEPIAELVIMAVIL